MRMSFVSVSLCLVALSARPARAQLFDTVGIRAQGMGGAFVALADDATATWWNPAGLAFGPFFNGILENTHADAEEMRSHGFALAFPSLALRYYRLPLNGIRPVGETTAPIPPGRKDLGALSVFGATVGQSIGSHLVVATTLKLLRGNDDTDSDLDIGAIVRFGHARFGAAVKNLRNPTLGSDLDA